NLGLCKSVEYFQSFKNNNIYGVLPFVTPEVLRAHDFRLALHICKDKRPKIIKNIPHCYINLMKKC
ncbi:18709_t:CDS:2, partial [Funneliformis geosporum]